MWWWCLMAVARVVCDARTVAAMPGRAVSSSDVTPEQSLLPAPELTNDPVSVEEEPVGTAVAIFITTTTIII